MADEASDPSSVWTQPTVQVILAATLMGVMGVSLISPALPAVRRGLGITEAEASLVLSAFTLPGIAMGPISGMLADRYGRRIVLIPSLLVYGVAGGAVMLAPGFLTVLGLRVLQGSAAAALITLAITLVGDAFDGSQRNAIMGLNGAVLSIGTGLYPLIGGALSAIDWRAPFAMYLIGVPVGLFALRVLEEPERQDQPGGIGYVTNALDALPTGRSLVLYSVALFVFVLLYGAILTVLPFLLEQGLSLSSVVIGIILGVPSAATALASSQNGRLARRYSNDAIIAAGIVSLGLGLVGLSVAPTAVWFGVAIMPFGAGMGLVMPSMDTAISGLVPTSFRGGAMSLRTSMVRLGQTIGPPLFTGLATFWASRSLLLGAGAVTLVVGALTLAVSARAFAHRST